MKYTVPKGIEIMKIREIQEEILRLKKERDFCILAHSYQTSDILEIADFTGDSYALSVKAIHRRRTCSCAACGSWRKL